MGFSYVTITGSYPGKTGTVTVTPVTEMTNSGQQISSREVYPIRNGSVLFRLAATDDPGTDPAGAEYVVSIQVAGQAPVQFSTIIPSALAGGNLDLSQLPYGYTPPPPTVAPALAPSNNLSDLTNPSAARTNLGLGSAATQPSSAFDPAGLAATDSAAATAAAEAQSLLRSNNLSDLASATVARANLGLGSAATQATSAFDPAGAAAAVLPLTGTAGAPTSGTWTAGQLAKDSAGRVWVCAVSGTPGTWVLSGAFAALTSVRSQDLLLQPTRITPGLISNITVSDPQGATGGYTLDAGNDLTKFAWSGCTKASAAAPVAHGNAGYTGLNAADSGDVRYAGVVDCMVQSASYQIAFCDYSGGANFFQVWIDDHLVQDATRVLTNGNTYYYTITLPSSRPHHLRLRFANLGFVGINRAVTDSVWAPTGPLYGAKAVLLGDSFVAGLYDPNLRHFGFDLCDLLGWECVPAGEPGTGYVNAGGAGQATYPARISTYVTPESPDVVVVLGSVNDFADTPASIQSACSTMLANLASALPKVPVFVFGIQWYFGADNTTFDAIDSALQAACRASSNGYFFSTKGWVTGSGMEKVQPPSLYMYSGGTGGTFAAGSYHWVVTATGSAGETTVSNEIGDTLAANATRTMRWVSNGTGEVNAKIYRGTTPGGENALIATVPFSNGTYTDTGTAGSGATPPASNTTTGPVGDGTADVLVTNANTHPTSAGHRNLAFRMAQAIASKFPTVTQQAAN